jgi:aspartate racemase
MKTVGIIGGIAPESTVVYYREIINEFLKRQTSGDYPQIIINSINMKKMLDFFPENNFNGLINYLSDEIYKLANSGADFGLLASNTPHIVFNELQEKSPIPLLSIVEQTCKKVKTFGLKKVGLFGTKFTMKNKFYHKEFEKEKIDIIVPSDNEQNFIHGIYFSELVKGIFKSETKNELLKIVDEMKLKDGIDGLILGGTELPLILKEEDSKDIPIFDTTKIHVEGIINSLFGK